MIVPEWSWEAGEDVYDTTLVIEDPEDTWDALSVSHLATIDLHDRVGLLDPNNWSVTSGTATPSQGPNNALDIDVTSATATLTFTNFPSLTGVWGDPPFWTIDEILPFEHWRFFDFIPLYREDPNDPWESGFEVGKVELEMAGIWWEVGSNHLTGSDHEQWLTTLDNWRLTWTSSRELYAAANVGGGLHEVVDLGWAVEGTTWQVRTVQEITLHLEQGYYRIEEALLRFLNRMDEHELLVPFLKRNTNDEGIFVDVSLADGKQSLARMPYFVYSIGAQSGIRVVSMMSLEQIKSGFNEGIWGTVEGTAFPGSYAGWEYKTGTTESWGYTASAADHPSLGLSQVEIDKLHEAGVNLPEEFYTKARWGVWAQHGQGPGSLYQPNGTKILPAWPRVHTFGASGLRMGASSTFHELTVRKFFSGAGHGLVPPDLIELEDAESALYPIRVDNQP